MTQEPDRGAAAANRGGGTRAFRLAAVAALVTLAACGDDLPTNPDALRFGQIGQVRVELQAPLRLGAGTLQQILMWASSGAWTLQEAISYRQLPGDVTFRRSPGNPALFAEGYASLITQVNEVQGQNLFVWEDTIPDPECGPTRTRLTLSIRDDAREEEKTWIRCADGSMANLTTLGAGPDAPAARVVLAAQLARNGTVGERFASAYAGSVPFGTLDRGDDTPTGIQEPTVLLSESAWREFWQSHTRSASSPPAVNFTTEMVVIGAVGTREEAGDSVEVRRILQIDEGTMTEVYERIPGDFCSPAALTHVPYHIVVAPRLPPPLRFADIRVEQVSCGG